MINTNLIVNDLPENTSVGPGRSFLGSFNTYGQNGIDYTKQDDGPHGTLVNTWNVSGLTIGSQIHRLGSAPTVIYPRVSIDNTKNYRFSIFIKRTRNVNNGTRDRIYFGLMVYDSNGTVNIFRISNSTNNINPYFVTPTNSNTNSTFTEGEWFLMVAYVLNKDYNSGYNTIYNGKIYDMDGNVDYEELNTNFQFLDNDPIEIAQRWFLYNTSSSVSSDEYQVYQPRIEEVDGTEPSITELLKTKKVVYDEIKVNNLLIDDWPNNITQSANGGFLGSYNVYVNNGINYTKQDTGPYGDLVNTWNISGTTEGNHILGTRTIDPKPRVKIYNTKNYRFSIFIKRTRNVNNGTRDRIYFGLITYNTSGSAMTIKRISNSVESDNNYFVTPDYSNTNSTFTEGEWFLMVGYVLNKDYNSGYNTIYNGKIYDMDGNVDYEELNTNYQFLDNDPDRVGMRWFILNPGLTSVSSDEYQVYQPRIEEVDGNEPSITELLQTKYNENNKIQLKKLDDGNLIVNDWRDYLGGGATTYFQNSFSHEGLNTRVVDETPFGNLDVMWETYCPHSMSTASFISRTLVDEEYLIPVDNTKEYRISCFFRKTERGIYDTSVGFEVYLYNNNTKELDVNRVQTNSWTTKPVPYWSNNYSTTFVVGNWYLMVAYFHNVNYPVDIPDSEYLGNMYNKDGTILPNTAELYTYKFSSTTNHMQIVFESKGGRDTNQFYQPRVEVVDGTEPSITELLSGVNLREKIITGNYNI